MFTFLLALSSLCVSIIALNKGFEHAHGSHSDIENKYGTFKLTEEDKEYFHFLTNQDSKDIFSATKDLFNQAIQEAIEHPEFGNINSSVIRSKTIYNFKIQLGITPTDILWEVFDLAQPVTLKSHHRFTMKFDRSLKEIIRDEMRINQGDTYNNASMLECFSEYGIPPFDFYELFSTLNNAGWNKMTSIPVQNIEEKNIKFELSPITEKISKLLHENESEIDQDVLNLFSDILTVINNITTDKHFNTTKNNNDIEFKHDLNRLIEQELLKILLIYLELDKKNKHSVKEMVIQSLEKAHQQLIKKIVDYQNQRISELKQTHLLMEKRYE